MQSLITLALILIPLFIGFAVPSSKKLLKISDSIIYYLVFIILFYIGLELSQVTGLAEQTTTIISYVMLLSLLTIGSGLLGLIIFDKVFPWQRSTHKNTSSPSVSMKGSITQISCVLIGFLAGKFLFGSYISTSYLPPTYTMTLLLMLLILFVGIGLKSSGITLRQVLMNKRGVQVSVIFTLSVWCGGIIFACMTPNVNVWQGLALSSGFGWYSLSGIMITDAFGAVWGSVALFNDLLREFFALVFIPIIMRKYPSAAVGSGGATSLDFTLPVIQQSGGLVVVPMAISFGFIVNIVAPICMVLFSSLA